MPHALNSSGVPTLLYLSRRDIEASGGRDPSLYVDTVSAALRLHAERKVFQPLKLYLRPTSDHPVDRIIAMPACLDGESTIVGIKWIGSRHDNPSRFTRERASALIVLNDPVTYYPVAVLEGALISAMRTAAVSIIASRALAKRKFRRMACIGCGMIGSAHLTSFLETFVHVETVLLFDRVRAAATGTLRRLRDRYPRIDSRLTRSAEEAVRGAEVIIACTTATEPYIRAEWLQTGAFISNISLMDVEKEVFLRADKVVVDDWEQCNREGKVIHELFQEGRFSRARVYAELGEIIAGLKPGREHDEEIIILNPMGLAIEDVACASAIYRLALAAGIGTTLQLY